MTQISSPCDQAFRLARGARKGTTGQWQAGAQHLASLSGHEWLLIDAVARIATPFGVPVSGGGEWLTSSFDEPSSFVAAVASLHVDGRVRERAVRLLADRAGPLAAKALAVRALDHVPQVREAALRGLAGITDVGLVDDVMSVLLAARSKRHGSSALEAVAGLLRERVSEPGVVEALMTSADREVRRWGFRLALDGGVLTREHLRGALRDENDQRVLAWCVYGLMARALPGDAAELLSSRRAEVRLGALEKVTEGELSDADLLELVVDRSARVREMARRRAARRGLDLRAWLRQEVAGDRRGASRRAACLEGLLDVGDADDLGRFGAAAADTSSRVRAVAVAGIALRCTPDGAWQALSPMLLDASPRVAASAARALARSGAPAGCAADAWRSAQPWSRRAAWMLSRAAGSWDRVEADLRAALDADERLSGHGDSGLLNWLDTKAATTWEPLPPDQGERIAGLLVRWPGVDEHKRVIAFHAGLTRAVMGPGPTHEEDRSRGSRWRRLLGRPRVSR